VLLVPTGVAPHKEIESDPGAAMRLRLTRRAAERYPRVEVSDAESHDEEPSYTFRTLERLADELPESEFTFLMGADAAAGLGGWRRPERVVELARIAVARRPGADVSGAEAALDRLGAGKRAAWIEMPELGISSSLIRGRVAAGRSVRGLVPDRVAELIEAKGLYLWRDG